MTANLALAGSLTQSRVRKAALYIMRLFMSPIPECDIIKLTGKESEANNIK